MQAEQYKVMLGWFKARPAAKKVIVGVSKTVVALVYLLYGSLLVWLAATRDALLLPVLVVPAAVFVLGTLLRRVINRPRPYTVLGAEPLFPKNTVGESMPSRHCFSAAAIAVAAWQVAPMLGILGGVLAAVVALSRVLTGVHWPSDVLAGLAMGTFLAIAGFVVWG